MQTQTSNTLHNAIMEAGSKDRPPMLAPGNYVQWKSRIKRYIDTKPNHELIYYCLENPSYKLDWKDTEVLIYEGSPITTTERIHETYKNVSQEIRDQLNAEAEVVQIILTRIDNDIYLTVDACPNACEMWKSIERSVGYENQRIGNVAGARETVGSSVVQKFGIQCYKCKEFRHVAKECQKPKKAKDAAYHKEKMLLCKQEEAGIQLNAEQADWRDDTDDDELEDQELERIICTWHKFKRFLQMLLTLDLSLMMNHCKREEIEQNDDDNDLAKERELLASLIEKLKCEIDENKNRNKFLETSNKVLIENLKGEIKDFKNKNKSLESSNNYFKEENNRLSETNNLLYADYKKSEAKLARRNSREYASQMELECAKVRGDLLSYKMEYQKSCTKYTETINDLNQKNSEMNDNLSAHQDTISILSQQKEAQLKLYKTREDKELDKVIQLENKVKVLDNIVYKTGQSDQMMNMLNNKCRTSFVKPEFLKKAQRANPHLYDIGCYNDNLTIMLAPDSDEVIRLEKESRSKLSDLIRPFDYDKLNNLYDLFVPQCEKSSEQLYFSERSILSHSMLTTKNQKRLLTNKQLCWRNGWMNPFSWIKNVKAL
nr:hypothetical protein [Tanacetum cinerariifolium]